jgi:DNA-binding NarL/FixJ family response regulator
MLRTDTHYKPRMKVKRPSRWHDLCRCGEWKRRSSDQCNECLRQVTQACAEQTQRTLLRFLAEGFTEKQIAKALHLSFEMVNQYLQRIKRQYQAKTLFQLAIRIRGAGIKI